MANQTITLQLTDFVVKGTAYITSWDGTNGCISMKPYHIPENNIDVILEGINDNGFGCQSIDLVDVDLYANYEGYLVHIDELLDIEVLKHNGKRGI